MKEKNSITLELWVYPQERDAFKKNKVDRIIMFKRGASDRVRMRITNPKIISEQPDFLVIGR